MLSSVSLFTSVNAGEVGVSGTAKATYNILSGKTNVGKGLGITNELNFTASGETDQGYTWNYSMELDPGAVADTGDTTGEQSQSAHNDDTQLTLGTPYGTFGVFISEGGLDVEDAASQSAYARPTDMGDPSGTSDNYTIDSYNKVQYHTPADMLPFGITAKVAYAPDLDDAYGSGNNAGAVSTKSSTFAGENATEIQVKAAPIDGLTIGASYFDFSQDGVAKMDQNAESGAYYATYSQGAVSVGYSQAYRAERLEDASVIASDKASNIDYYDQTNYSIAFAASDDITVSYENETSEAVKVQSGTTNVEQKSTGVQIAYTMGGMTLALAHNSHDNNGYVTGANVDQTLLAVTMAF